MQQLRTVIPLLALTLLSCAGALAQEGGGNEPDYTLPGPHQVGTLESLLLGSIVGDNAVEVRINYPEGEGPFPVVVFSHGLRAGKDVYTEITNYWASHGFVTIQPQHNDAGVEFGPDGMQPPEEKVLERLDNVTTALDSLDRIEASVPGLEGKLERDNLAVAGHSYGSFITMLAGGVTVESGEGNNRSLRDERVQCIIPISPSGRGDYGMNDDSFSDLDIPALFITGTEDIRGGRDRDWRMEPYNLSPPGDKFLLVIQGAGHGDFGGESASDAPDYVKAASGAFLDYCLNDARDGLSFLTSPDGFRAFAGEQATIESK